MTDQEKDDLMFEIDQIEEDIEALEEEFQGVDDELSILEANGDFDNEEYHELVNEQSYIETELMRLQEERDALQLILTGQIERRPLW